MQVTTLTFTIIIAVILSSLQVRCTVVPKIICDSTSKITNAGSVIEFDCTVKDAEDYPVLWFREIDDDVIPLTAGNVVVTRDRRISIRTSRTRYLLRIEDVQPSDAGNYRCEISVSVGIQLFVTIALKVLYPPDIRNESRTLTVAPGESISLDCYATGYPEPIVYWKREDGSSLPNGQTVYTGNVLTLPDFSDRLAGTYNCVADNTVEPKSVRNVTVALQTFRME